jgi:hypothetical protein
MEIAVDPERPFEVTKETLDLFRRYWKKEVSEEDLHAVASAVRTKALAVCNYR